LEFGLSLEFGRKSVFQKILPEKKHTHKKHGTAVNFAGTKGSGVEP